MSLFLNCLIVVVVVFGVGVLAGLMLAATHEQDKVEEELLPIEIGEVVDDAKQ